MYYIIYFYSIIIILSNYNETDISTGERETGTNATTSGICALYIVNVCQPILRVAKAKRKTALALVFCLLNDTSF